MSPFQGLGEGATAFPGLRPGLSYLAPSGHQSDPPAQRSRRRQRAPRASRDSLAFSQRQAAGLSSLLPPPPAPGIDYGAPNGTNLGRNALNSSNLWLEVRTPSADARHRTKLP